MKSSKAKIKKNKRPIEHNYRA